MALSKLLVKRTVRTFERTKTKPVTRPEVTVRRKKDRRVVKTVKTWSMEEWQGLK